MFFKRKMASNLTYGLALAAFLLVLATAHGLDCYNCITSSPNWATEKCAAELKTGCTGFCAKATFQGGLTVRMCNKGGLGKAKDFEANVCKKVKAFMKTPYASKTMKAKWALKPNKDMIAAACDPKPGKPAQPKSAYTCTKGKCNGSTSLTAGSAAAILAPVVAFMLTLGR